MEHSLQETERRLFATPTGLSPSTFTASVYTQEKRQKACFRYSRHEVQSDASSLLACFGPSGRNHGGPEFVRLPSRTLYGRRDRAVLRHSRPAECTAMDTRGRNKKLF